jgi:ectoine hydroxylase-related dioxygenase (phytanoyl-CoA dioxygenase family)
VLTAWIALDDATLENGCLHYISGSHRGPLLPHTTVEGKHGGDLITQLRAKNGNSWSNALDLDAKAALANAQIHDEQLDQRRRQAVTVKRGGVIFHHGNVVHGSSANHTEHWRRAYSSHWIAQGATSTSSILETSKEIRQQQQAAVERREGQQLQPRL